MFRILNKKIVAVFFVIGLFLPDFAAAQKYPLELFVSSQSTSGLQEHDDGTVGLEVQHASLLVPLSPLETFKAIVYLKNNQKKFTYDEFPASIDLQKTAQTYSIDDFPEELTLSSMGLLLALNLEKSLWIFRRDSVIASDNENISEKDSAFVNQFIYRTKSGGPSDWTFGFSHNGGISDDTFYPLLGYSYTSDTVSFRMILPAFGYVQYRLSEHTYFLFDTTIERDSYRLTEDAPWDNAIFRLTNVNSRIELGLRTSSGLELGVSYGMVMFRLWDIKDKDQNELGNFHMKNTSQLSVQIQFLM